MVNKEKIILLIIFLIALIIRIAVILNFPGKNTAAVSDEQYYDSIAINLAQGQDFSYQNNQPTSWVVPVYPLFLCGIYKIAGHNYIVARFFQALLSSLTCLIVYFIAINLSAKITALLSASVTAFYPAFINYSKYLLPETLFTFLFALAVVYLLKTKQNSLLRNKAIAAVLLGMASLTKPIVILFPVFVFIWMLACFQFNLKQKFKDFIIIISFFFLALSPWIIRNFIVHNELIIADTHTGFSFYGGNNPLAKGKPTAVKDINPSLQQLEKRFSEDEMNKIYFEEGIKFIKNQSLFQAVKLSTQKILYSLSPFEQKYRISFGILFPFSLIGFLLSLKYKNKFLLLELILLYFLIAAIIFFGAPRYRVPILPYLIIFASVGIVRLYTGFSNKVFPILIYIFILAGNLFIYTNPYPIKMCLKNMLNL
ncbi:MAG: glycosyltransferase family 39 protein [Candidatus Omnitrophica bacterium]|nr:glycosyltransferase family 39 protein [Candidatus Omnitrophota bacterium]